MHYDIIGDIHGQPGKLVTLLTTLGYEKIQGVWRHSERKALFVGDYIDRGPGQLEVLRIVRAMVDAGTAVAIMGNHEFNAIAWHTRDPLTLNEHLRRHTDKNRHQHAAFLAEVEGTPEHDTWINWFKTLPLWWEDAHVRAIHACWHPEHMATLRPLLGPGNTLTEELIEASSRKGSSAYVAVEDLLKGLEVDLPAGCVYRDADGHERSRTRVRWWDMEARTYRRGAMVPPASQDQLPDTPLPPEACVNYDGAKPLFFGHYWFTGQPQVLNPHMCCVDFSAAKAGHPLVAYRYHGEKQLDPRHLLAAWHGAPLKASRLRVR